MSVMPNQRFSMNGVKEAGTNSDEGLKLNYYKSVRVSNFWSKNYIEYKSNDDRNKTLSVKEYLNKIRAYLKGIINNLKKSGTWKIQ